MSDQSFLSWPFFEDHHRELATGLSRWAKATLPGLVDHHDVDGSCKRLVKALGDGGWLRAAVPASHGGMFPTFDVRSLCLIRETLAYESGLADFAFAMQGSRHRPDQPVRFGSIEVALSAARRQR